MKAQTITSILQFVDEHLTDQTCDMPNLISAFVNYSQQTFKVSRTWSLAVFGWWILKIIIVEKLCCIGFLALLCPDISKSLYLRKHLHGKQIVAEKTLILN